MDQRRIITRYPADQTPVPGPVLYWMSREQRIEDNWPLVYAQELALKNSQPLIVVFTLISPYLKANHHHYEFMLRGLQAVARGLTEKNIPFAVITGDPLKSLASFVEEHNISRVVTDFDPLRDKRKLQKQFADLGITSLDVVDGRNIVPITTASEKQQYAAYTLRPRLHRLLEDFLYQQPTIKTHPAAYRLTFPEPDWEKLLKDLDAVKNPYWEAHYPSGPEAALTKMQDFIDHRLQYYSQDSNDPNKDVLSGLSPYLHFGQLSAQRVLLALEESSFPAEITAPFVEQIFVRKELSDNYCYYNKISNNTQHTISGKTGNK